MVSTRVFFSASVLLSVSAVCAQTPVQSFQPANTPPSTASAPAARQITPVERGDVLMARKMFREAIESYREGPQNSAVVWDKIGIAYHQLGDLNAAKKNYEHAIKLNKKYADAINNVGTIFYAQKKYRSAIARYEKALKISPDSASIWSNLGTAYFARGKFDDMSKAYAKALALDPNVFGLHGSVGTQMQDRGVEDKARYHYEMARVYAGQGKNDLALQYLRKAFEEGFKDKEKLNKATEFAGLRETQEFKDLVAQQFRVL